MTNNLLSMDGEIGVLSIILTHPNSIYEIRDLKSFMFSSLAHKLIFETILEIVEQNSVPDVNLVRDWLHSKKNLEKIGGHEYLKYLTSQAYDIKNINEYQKLVVDSYKARSLINLSTNLTSEVHNTSDVSGLITRVRNQLDNLSITSGGEKTVLIADVLPEIWEALKHRIENPGQLTGVPVGFKNVDNMIGGMRGGELWFIAGRPGMGKTAVMVNSIINNAKNGIKSLTFQYEMGKESFSERLFALESKVDLNKIRMGAVVDQDVEELQRGVRVVGALPIYIDYSTDTNLSYVINTIRKFHYKEQIDVVYIDYIQLMIQRDEYAVQELGRLSRGLKLLAQELDIPIVVLSQLHRGVEQRENKKPILSDLRQSGNLEEDADVVVMLYREKYYNQKDKSNDRLEFLIRKNRNGPIGSLPLIFHEGTNLIISEKM